MHYVDDPQNSLFSLSIFPTGQFSLSEYYKHLLSNLVVRRSSHYSSYDDQTLGANPAVEAICRDQPYYRTNRNTEIILLKARCRYW